MKIIFSVLLLVSLSGFAWSESTPQLTLRISSYANLKKNISEIASLAQPGLGEMLPIMLNLNLHAKLDNLEFKGANLNQPIFFMANLKKSGAFSGAWFIPLSDEEKFIDGFEPSSPILSKEYKKEYCDSFLIIYKAEEKNPLFTDWTKLPDPGGLGLIDLHLSPQGVQQSLIQPLESLLILQKLMSSFSSKDEGSSLSTIISAQIKILRVLKDGLHGGSLSLRKEDKNIYLDLSLHPKKNSRLTALLPSSGQASPLLSNLYEEKSDFKILGQIGFRNTHIKWLEEYFTRLYINWLGEVKSNQLGEDISRILNLCLPANIYSSGAFRRGKSEGVLQHTQLNERLLLIAFAKLADTLQTQAGEHKEALYRKVLYVQKEKSILGTSIHRLRLEINPSHPLYRDSGSSSSEINFRFATLDDLLICSTRSEEQMVGLIKRVLQSPKKGSSKVNSELKGVVNLSSLFKSFAQVNQTYAEPLKLWLSKNDRKEILLNFKTKFLKNPAFSLSTSEESLVDMIKAWIKIKQSASH